LDERSYREAVSFPTQFEKVGGSRYADRFAADRFAADSAGTNTSGQDNSGGSGFADRFGFLGSVSKEF